MDDFNYNTLSKKILKVKEKGNGSLLAISENRPLRVPAIDLGIIGYEKAYKLQLEIFELVKERGVPGVILMLEHNPVITIGNNGNRSNVVVNEKSLYSQGIELINSNRGGDVTFHGPGQLVCYTIFNLNKFGKDLTLFVYNLEEVIIKILAYYGIKGFRIEKLRGVFTEKGKIASIGLHVKKWVTIHGFSFNVNIDLDYFKNIVACGLKDFRQTSLNEILDAEISIPDIKKYVLETFKTVFEIEVINTFI